MRGLYPAAGLLIVAVAIQLASHCIRSGSATPRPKLGTTIPAELPGWTSRPLAVAETEELRRAVETILQFDDVFTRGYTQGGREISIYAAYWAPGKIPPRSVGAHTPDTCWVQNGWQCLDRDYAVPLAIPAGPLLPAERGTYALHGNVQHVLFWHLVGHRPYSYKQSGRHALTAPLQDLLTFGLNQRRDQLFVRIASNRPFDELWSDAGLQTLLSSFARQDVAPR